MNQTNRRHFIQSVLGLTASACVGVGCHSWPHHRVGQPPSNRLFFVSKGKTGLIHSEGSGLRYLDFQVPNQATWQPTGFFSDGHRVLLLSMEPRRDGPGRPFDQYYTQTPTHIWIHNLDNGSLEEIATKDRMAVFYTPQLLISDDRILMQVAKNGSGQIFSMNLDGSDAREFTRLGEGFPYGLSLSPDRRRVAFHLATGGGYEIWVGDLEGKQKRKVAARNGHIYFAPAWSPDGEWLAFQDCEPGKDPGHDWSDVCVCRPDGTEFRSLTEGSAMWFGATYGNAAHRGGGSNVVQWTQEGHLLFPRRLTDSKVAWEYQPQRPDTDHFNRDYKPELARGGTFLCRLDPKTRETQALTPPTPGIWDFRGSQSQDGREIVFCRAATGEQPTLFVMSSSGGHPREITRGMDNEGLDHPRWLPTRKTPQH